MPCCEQGNVGPFHTIALRSEIWGDAVIVDQTLGGSLSRPCKPREKSNGMSTSLCSPWAMSWVTPSSSSSSSRQYVDGAREPSDEWQHRISAFDSHETHYHGAARDEVERAPSVPQRATWCWRQRPTLLAQHNIGDALAARFGRQSELERDNDPPHASRGFLQCCHPADSQCLQHFVGNLGSGEPHRHD